MAQSDKQFNEKLYNFLTSYGFDGIKTLSSKGEQVPDASQADVLQFHYKNKDYDYGTVTLALLDNKVTIFYNQSVVKDPDRGIDTQWITFLKKLKDWSLRKGQKGFKPLDIDKLGDEMKRRTKQKNDEKLLEGYYGTRLTSYSDSTPPSIRMIIKHSKPLSETDKRYRNIEKIFLETERGERLLLNTKKPSIGRVFARHLAEGGEYNDDRWHHIAEISEDIGKLGGFVRATRAKQFNESTSRIVQEANNHYAALRETIRKLQNSRGYKQYFESWQPTLMEQTVENDFNSMFVTSSIDPRITQALPVLNKLNVSFTEISEASEFEQWANKILEGRSPEEDKKIEELVDLLSGDEKVPVGADAMSIKGQIEDLISDDHDREHLFARLDRVARADSDHDAVPVILAWLEEHSDHGFYGDVLEKVESAGVSAPSEKPEPAQPAANKKPAVATAPAGNAAAGGPSPADVKAAAPLMPAPLAEDDQLTEKKSSSSKPAQRNFVAKHAQRSGAGKHTPSKGYKRQQKHPSKLAEETVDVVEEINQEEENLLMAIKRLSTFK